MEKRTPHCKLATVKILIEEGKVRMTYGALEGAKRLGLDRRGILEVLLTLESSDFTKSMTTYADHTIWQDVYCPKSSVGDIYLKLTVIEDVLVVSFKEL